MTRVEEERPERLRVPAVLPEAPTEARCLEDHRVGAREVPLTRCRDVDERLDSVALERGDPLERVLAREIVVEAGLEAVDPSYERIGLDRMEPSPGRARLAQRRVAPGDARAAVCAPDLA